MWLVRPYPVAAIAQAKRAIAAAAEGDVAPMRALYAEARDALLHVDPFEVKDSEREHAKAATSDKHAARSVKHVSADWEAIVAVGATIEDAFRFRGFAWAVAAERYELGGRFEDFVEGEDFVGVSAEDGALYVALPALVGLGPELAEELPGPCPLAGEPVHRLLGLPDSDVEDIDPLDGLAVSTESLRAQFPGLTGAWKLLAARSTELGLLIRKA